MVYFTALKCAGPILNCFLNLSRMVLKLFGNAFLPFEPSKLTCWHHWEYRTKLTWCLKISRAYRLGCPLQWLSAVGGGFPVDLTLQPRVLIYFYL
ncbi:hypothetical protein FKM82_017156 [Ascaphus truei]